MQVMPLPLEGACVIDIDRQEDARGFFARVFDRALLARAGLHAEIIQSSISFNARRGTLRGMHWQSAPCEEEKFVRCTRGAIYDVIVDMRPTSVQYCKWTALELSEQNHRTLYIPKGFAHGFLTLVDESEILYDMTTPFAPECSRGVRFDDPTLAIKWPFVEELVISEKDLSYPQLAP